MKGTQNAECLTVAPKKEKKKKQNEVLHKILSKKLFHFSCFIHVCTSIIKTFKYLFSKMFGPLKLTGGEQDVF